MYANFKEMLIANWHQYLNPETAVERQGCVYFRESSSSENIHIMFTTFLNTHLNTFTHFLSPETKSDVTFSYSVSVNRKLI